jgi:hypothetical protein
VVAEGAFVFFIWPAGGVIFFGALAGCGASRRFSGLTVPAI